MLTNLKTKFKQLFCIHAYQNVFYHDLHRYVATCVKCQHKKMKY